MAASHVERVLAEYDSVHGDGAFAALPIPNAGDAVRPAPQFREIPERGKPGHADLGYWNFVDLRSGEDNTRLLANMIGAVKTPTLRNLAYTAPYMHTGTLQNLEETLAEMIRLKGLADRQQLRAADDALAAMRITAADIPPLVAFLATLNDR